MRRILLATVFAAAATSALGEAVTSAPAAMLRGLDRLSGEVTDLEVRVGDTARLGRLSVQLSDCRYPSENPAGDAYVYLIISDTQTGAWLFEGWMIASSPALNAFDHMRYDVWPLRCITS